MSDGGIGRRLNGKMLLMPLRALCKVQILTHSNYKQGWVVRQLAYIIGTDPRVTGAV